jgi:hypothetical protein
MARHRTAFRTTVGRAHASARARWGLLAALCWSCLLGSSGTARAYEDQASLDLASGALVTAGARHLHQAGPSVSLGGTLGLGESYLVRGQLAYLPLFEHGSLQNVGRFLVEGAYAFDVLKLVPFVGVGASLWLYEPVGSWTVRPAAHVLLGFDYLWSRALSLGFDLRVGAVFERSHVASATEAQVRLSRMFDLF